MSLIIDLADAITADLAAEDFGIVIPWERSYAEWDLELKESKAPRGDVVPVFGSNVELEDRATLLYELTIDILIRRRFEKDDVDVNGKLLKAGIDELVDVLEAVHKHFAKSEPIENVSWNPSSDRRIQAWYVKAHLRNWNQFTGIVRLPYDARQDL